MGKRERGGRVYAAVIRACRWTWDRLPAGSLGAYGLALVTVFVAASTRFAVDLLQLPGQILFFPTFFAAIALSAMIGGFGPGLVAAVTSFVVGWYAFYPPRGIWAFNGPTDVVNAILFGASALVIAGSGGMFRWMAHDLLRTERALADSNAEIGRALRESVHRTRNLLAVVQAMVRQTLRDTTSPAAFAAALTERLAAMGRAQDVLLASNDDDADLAVLIQTALAPFEGLPGFAMTAGPSAPVRPETIIALTLALHELGTNALKHGGLAPGGGGAHVGWRVDPDGVATIEWRERADLRGGSGPDGKGSPLIRAALGAEEDGSVVHALTPEGLQCTLRYRPRRRSA